MDGFGVLHWPGNRTEGNAKKGKGEIWKGTERMEAFLVFNWIGQGTEGNGKTPKREREKMNKNGMERKKWKNGIILILWLPGWNGRKRRKRIGKEGKKRKDL